MWKKGFVIENDTSGRNIVEKEMVSYIQQNFTGKISLKEFGEQFHLSEKYVSQYFKEHFHITLSNMLHICGWSMQNSCYKIRTFQLQRLQCSVAIRM